MKAIRNVYKIAIALCLAVSCENRGIRPPIYSIGTFAATMNGSEWSNTYKNAYQTVFGSVDGEGDDRYHAVSSILWSSQNYQRQFIAFSKIPRQVGRFEFDRCGLIDCEYRGNPFARFSAWVGDGDYYSDSYGILEIEDNYIQIDSYNVITKETKGRFQVSFVVRQPKRYVTLPDTLRFRNGKFHTRVENLKERR